MFLNFMTTRSPSFMNSYNIQRDEGMTTTNVESIITQVDKNSATIEMKHYEKKEISYGKDGKISKLEEKLDVEDVTVDSDLKITRKSKSSLQRFLSKNLFSQLFCCLAPSIDSSSTKLKPLQHETPIPIPPTPIKARIDNASDQASEQQSQLAKQEDSHSPVPHKIRKPSKVKRHSASVQRKEEAQRWLLPEPKPEHKNKKTLVLDLDETLVHSSFKPVKGADFIVQVEIERVIHNVYVCKRPGVDEFLQEVGKLFEVVVFTASLSKYADPVMDYLDPSRVISGRLFREHCTYMHGNYVKDLSRLGRDISQVIIVDNSPCCYQLQPENAMAIVSWFDDPTDSHLNDMLPWLYKVANENNVFETLEEYKHANSPQFS
jgi:RNA polymerase II subunit A small phosphatase-like protein